MEATNCLEPSTHFICLCQSHNSSQFSVPIIRCLTTLAEPLGEFVWVIVGIFPPVLTGGLDHSSPPPRVDVEVVNVRCQPFWVTICWPHSRASIELTDQRLVQRLTRCQFVHEFECFVDFRVLSVEAHLQIVEWPATHKSKFASPAIKIPGSWIIKVVLLATPDLDVCPQLFYCFADLLVGQYVIEYDKTEGIKEVSDLLRVMVVKVKGRCEALLIKFEPWCLEYLCLLLHQVLLQILQYSLSIQADE